MGSGLVTLLTVEEQTLAGLGRPGSDVVSNVSNLVGLEGGNRLQIDGLRTEPEELLGIEEVPETLKLAHVLTGAVSRNVADYVLGEVGALVLEVALLNRLGLLLGLLILLGLLSRSSGGLRLGGGGAGSRRLSSSRLGGFSSRSSFSLTSGSSSLGGLGLGGRLGGGSLLRHVGGLLCVGHFDVLGLLVKQGISRKLENGVLGITGRQSKKKQVPLCDELLSRRGLH